MSLFNKKQEQKEEVQQANLSNNIGKGTVITGDIDCPGNIRIEGRIIGNIRSKSKVVLGNGSFVEGNITAQNAEIEGEVKGTIEVADVLTLKGTALINGDIFTAKLVTEPGAKFNGKCQMDGSMPSQQQQPSADSGIRKNVNANSNGINAGSPYAGKKAEAAA